VAGGTATATTPTSTAGLSEDSPEALQTASAGTPGNKLTRFVVI